MYDKQVRRRRLVLAVFVVTQLIVPWRAAFRSEDEEPAQRPIAFAA